MNQSYFCTMPGASARRIYTENARRAAERFAWAFHIKQEYSAYGGVWRYQLRVDSAPYEVEFSTSVFVKIRELETVS